MPVLEQVRGNQSTPSIDYGAFGKNVGNKAKGRISKQVFQENETRRIFRQMNFP